jgi:hypothetical protein
VSYLSAGVTCIIGREKHVAGGDLIRWPGPRPNCFRLADSGGAKLAVENISFYKQASPPLYFDQSFVRAASLVSSR